MLITRPRSPQEHGHRFLFAPESASLLCLEVRLQAQTTLKVEPHLPCSKDRGKTALSTERFQLLPKGPTISCKSRSLLGQRALRIRTSEEIGVKSTLCQCPPWAEPGDTETPELLAFGAVQCQHHLGKSQKGLGQWVNLLLKPQDEGTHTSM